MTNVDQFESVFRAASKAVYRHQSPEFERVLVVTDLPRSEVDAFTGRVRDFLSVLGPHVEWRSVSGEAFDTVGELLAVVGREEPDLVCSYRHLRSGGWRWSYSLGEYVDVLTQVAEAPVVLLPHPSSGRAASHSMQNTDVVMAMTDHLAGDDNLVHHAARFTRPGGCLLLAHIEDDGAFERYMGVISKIPALDTEVARETILAQLLKEPRDYIDSVREVLDRSGVELQAEPVVARGHHLREYERLVAEHKVDLLVMNTKDQDQMAMHGLAYPLAVELRSIPLLLI